MYLKKEIIISFLIMTISASNLYMPMIWLYVFLQDFLIPFLRDPDLQCGVRIRVKETAEIGTGMAGKSSWDQGNRRQKLVLVGEN